MNRPPLASEEQAIYECLLAARTIQEYLWGDDTATDLRTFNRIIMKRFKCIAFIDTKRPGWKVELRKRLLQTASLAINCMARLDGGRTSTSTT